MSTERLTMRKIKEVLRLRLDHQRTLKQIAVSCNIGRTTVSDYLNRFEDSRLSWPLPSDMEDTQLESRLFPSARVDPDPEKGLPEWQYIHQELRRKAVSLMLQTFPDSYILHGTPARQFTQVGNAVPPLLSAKIAKEMLCQLL